MKKNVHINHKQNSMTIILTPTQIWFIKCAIELKNSVIQLEGIDDKTFKEDYGATKEQIKAEIKDLSEQLNTP